MSTDVERVRIRIPHRIVDEDCWYSCAQAKHDDGEWACCDDSRRGGPCDCGVDRVNAYIENLEQRLIANKRRGEVLRAALAGLLDDTQHAQHADCEDGPCPVRDAREALQREVNE